MYSTVCNIVLLLQFVFFGKNEFAKQSTRLANEQL